jgi:hypothetical protein
MGWVIFCKFAFMRKLLFVAIMLIPFLASAQDTTGRIQVDTANQKPMSMADTLVIHQYDGPTLHIVCNGNAFESYCETLDGYTLAMNERGLYEYAVTVKGGNLIPNGVAAHDKEERKGPERRMLKGIQKHLRFSDEKLQKLKEDERKMREDPAYIKRYRKKK